MKRHLMLFIPLALLVMLATVGIGVTLNRSELAALKDHETRFLTVGAEIIHNFLEAPLNHLHGLAQEPDVKLAMASSGDKARSLMANSLQTLMYRNPRYDQARWLDAAGREIVRINNTTSGPVIVPAAQLQDKSDRYYFKETIRLPPDHIYVSPLDLNIERNQIEVPHKPMLRLALRLPQVAGRDQGMLVINVKAREIFDHLRQIVPQGHEAHPLLLNQAGYWLMGPRQDDTWGFMFGRDTTLAKRYPAEWGHMSREPDGEARTASGLWFWTTVDVAYLNPATIRCAEKWVLATHVPAGEITLLQWRQWRPLVVLALLTLVLLAAGIYYYIRLLIEKEQAKASLNLLAVRQEAEARVAASEERLRFALSASGTAAWSIDLASGKVLRSANHDSIFGYAEPVAEWTTELFASHILPEDRLLVEEHMRQGATTQEPLPLECRIRRTDGAVRWIEIIARSRCDDTGRPITQEGIIRDITLRKETEQSLHDIEMKFLVFSNSTSNAMILVDDQGIITFWNPAAERMFGYRADEILGQYLHDLLVPERDRQKAGEAVRHFAATGQGAALGATRELQALHRSGAEFPIELALTGFQIDGRHFAGGIVRDISVRKRLEAELESERDRLAGIIRGTNIGTWEWHIPSGEVVFNERWAEIIGYTLEELAPMSIATWEQHTHPDDLAISNRLLEQHFRRESEYYELEVRMKHKDGSWVWVLDRGSVTDWWDDGSPLVMRGTHQDITSRKRIEEALSKSEAMLRLITDKSLDAIFIKDRDSRYLYVNPAMERIMGKPAAELLEKSVGEIHPAPEVRRAILANDHRIMEQGRAETVEENVDTIAGRRLFLTTKTPWYDEHGNMAGLAGIARDITDRKQVEVHLQEAKAMAEQANQMKSDFLANMSHELRTPLTTILGNTEILNEEMFGPLNEKQRMAVQLTERSSRHLLDLINEILDLAKIDAGKMTLDTNPVCLKDVCESCLQFIREQALRKQIRTSLELGDCPEYFIADQLRLKQILINLLTNAVKFTPARGEVTLEVVTCRQNERLQIIVRDTGIGISADDQIRLFNPFIQIDSSLDRRHEGTGLGLALVKRLSQLMGGDVTLESEPGKGSRFTVTLPLEEYVTAKAALPAEPGIPVEPVTAVSADFGPTILLADDNPTNNEMMAVYLTRRGCRVITARNGKQAVELTSAENPDVVIMDIQMPEMNGLDAIRLIRSLAPPLGTVPIIAVTALAMPGDMERCLEAGADEYVRKPLKLNNLLLTIQTLLKEPPEMRKGASRMSGMKSDDLPDATE